MSQVWSFKEACHISRHYVLSIFNVERLLKFEEMIIFLLFSHPQVRLWLNLFPIEWKIICYDTLRIFTLRLDVICQIQLLKYSYSIRNDHFYIHLKLLKWFTIAKWCYLVISLILSIVFIYLRVQCNHTVLIKWTSWVKILLLGIFWQTVEYQFCDDFLILFYGVFDRSHHKKIIASVAVIRIRDIVMWIK